MSRLTAPARLAALALALIFPLLAWVAPAHAVDPKQTTIGLTADADLEEDTTIRLGTYVSSYPRAVGTFTFRDADGNVIGGGSSVPGNGSMSIVVPKPSGPTTFSVDFASDDPAWSDATTTLNWFAKNVKTVTVSMQPTIVKLNGLVPTLTLTLAATFKLKDGTGVPGMHIYNYMLCDPGPNRYCGLSVPLCEATSDANGLATCKGSGTLGALVSILGGDTVKTLFYDTQNPHRDYNYVFKPATFPIIG